MCPRQMTIAQLRLAHQRIGSAQPAQPGEVVAGLGFVQAQDYLSALWAVGVRLPGAREADIEQALAERSFVRTWPARGTLHFVAAADVRWMLSLLSPRQMGRSAGRLRQLGLDDADFARSRDAILKALHGGRQLPREALYQALEAAHVSTAGQRGIHIVGGLAQQGLLCFGARQGKQHTFTLLDEWLPPASDRGRAQPLTRDQALAELTRRYFTGHGPAALPDFAWWSGLTTTEARAGLALAQPHLTSIVVDGQTFWQSVTERAAVPAALPDACLLPAFDEYLVGYKDRSAVLDPRYAKMTNNGGGILSPVIVLDGQVAGTWKRTLKKDTVIIFPKWFTAPRKAQQAALARAAQQYGAFLGRTVEIAA
jgi:hypothetical protein